MVASGTCNPTPETMTMAAKAKRAAIYLRVSTDGQTTENQRLALMAVADQRGWTVANVYEDAGISGAKGRDKRPGLDALLKDAARGRFDVVMAWAMDRLGRSPEPPRVCRRLHILRGWSHDDLQSIFI
jgi:DNA invertase Pin-like site-specific DNA recombinase